MFLLFLFIIVCFFILKWRDTNVVSCCFDAACWEGKTTKTTFTTSNNASRGQNTLRVYTILLQGKQPKTTASPGQYYNCFSCKGNLVVKYCKCCICCFLFIPLIPSFSDDSFLCEKRRGLLRALPWNILLVLNSDLYYFYFPVLKIGPWANPINDD